MITTNKETQYYRYEDSRTIIHAERLQMNYELARTKLEQMRKLKQELRSLRNL
ncbi:hypothetical protein [Paenibacillus silviterrae]|uniref:hypothetical protein n=1 Tax=Paenibacillus silviterrae TaxID=3242194 RepID=UPI002542FE05|nr:hypothetical protein [Paenibacillus chinjuensis]